MTPEGDSIAMPRSSTPPPPTIVEPIPLLQLPFIVPELQAEIEILRVAVYNLVESRKKLLDALESCNTLEDLKVTLRGFYLETARQEIVDGLRDASRPHPTEIDRPPSSPEKP